MQYFGESLTREVRRTPLPRTRRCLTCRHNRLGGTQHLARGVLSPYADVRLGRRHLDGRLEAPTGDGPSLLQSVGSGAGQHLPVGDPRCAVPAGVERNLVVGAGLDRYGGLSFLLSAPRETEGSV